MPDLAATRVQRDANDGRLHQPDREPRAVVQRTNPARADATTRRTRPTVPVEQSTTAIPSPVIQPPVSQPGPAFTLEKAFVGFGFLVSFVLVMLFGFDLICAWPLGRYVPAAEGVFLGCGLALGYLSWDTYRGLR